ncbi:hypothetical protein ISN45_At03g004300 [Arabidopsis thaliana x Arabidopsis arenosa]|uniref:Uncharacterized protein n=2 Tax=Arabidopsis TaxID=3701 RepID=A0A8T2FEW6_ARASU|nr:hypothetical protein ISN45_At03g004300 [Arabidopsis thaliana x Arabidopsis arenosa]KAG7630041.1 hypothetical protein ISN44_As03g004250 [Arabidopsis suecica]
MCIGLYNLRWGGPNTTNSTVNGQPYVVWAAVHVMPISSTLKYGNVVFFHKGA